MERLIVDVATAPLANAGDYLTPAAERTPPKNYTKAESIAKWQQDDFDAELADCGLDWDLSRITGIGFDDGRSASQLLCRDDADERTALTVLAEFIDDNAPTLITYNGLAFDLPVLVMRARYLDLPFPALNTDKYRSPHRDLLLELSRHDPKHRKSLDFYRRRLGWIDLVKPLDGEAESAIFQHQRWDDLRESIRVDVESIHRLATWMDLYKSAEVA